MKFRLKSTLVPIAALAILTSAHTAKAQYIGDAYGLALNLNVLTIVGVGTVVGDTGNLPAAGGGPLTYNTLSASVGTGGLGGLGATTGVINNSTVGTGGVVNSSAQVNNLAALPPLLNNISLTANTVQSTATANSGGQSGTTTITGLQFGGVNVNVTGAANQTVVDALGNTLVINEQIHNANGSLTVNALDLTLVGGTVKLRVASSTAGFPSAATPEPGSVALFAGVMLSGGCFAVRRRRRKITR